MKVSRRGLLGSGIALGLVSCTGDDTKTPTTCPPAGPLAPTFTIAVSIPQDGHPYFMHDPGMCILPSGDILVAAPCWNEDSNAVRTFVARSSDGGKTFAVVATLPYSDATPFVQNGTLYMFVQPKQWQDFSIVTSADAGTTWSAPSLIFQGVYWNCHTGMVVQNGRLYWAMQTVVADWTACSLAVVSADITADLTSPSAWRRSNDLAHPATPPSLVAAVARPASELWWGFTDSNGNNADAWLEPNVVMVGNTIRVMLRTVLEGYGTAGVGIVCDFVDDASGGNVTFTQFYPWPGAQNKCFVLYDATSKLFWMLSNSVADSQGVVFDWQSVRASGHFLNGPGNDRRFLMLWYGVDALNWFPAGCVARAAKLSQSFMYPVGTIDGDDLVLISRTSINGDSQHDADAVTFHRVPQFRSLAMNLFPES